MLQFLTNLRRFDAYSKTIEDVRVQTYGGGAITIISFIIMHLLFWSEIRDYLTPNITEELFVDTSRSPHVQINVDITVPSISCSFLALDAMDTSGEQQLEINHNIYKRRLDLTGKPIDEPKRENITAKIKQNSTQTANKTECGSCYGASDGCCNTCEEVKEAYRARKWALDSIQNITQCKDDDFNKKLSAALKEGCRIYGNLIVNRVSGAFHIAPGESFSVSHLHVHDVQPFSSKEFNTSHLINEVSFGENVAVDSHSPLKGTKGIANEGATMFQYYIKIVPTTFHRRDNTIINTNQFSVTKHQKVISLVNGETGMPGIFFQYEFSPLMVKVTEKDRSFMHFVTNVCAIIGGVYTVAGLLDSLIYHSVKVVQRKMELGKLG